MMNRRAVDLIAERLPNGLIHPGDDNQPPKAIPLPGLTNIGIPPEMADHFAREAGLPTNDAPKLIAEAIVHLLETDGGLELAPRAEREQLRKAAAEQPDQLLPVPCAECGKPLFYHVLKGNQPRPMYRRLLKLAAESECPHEVA